MGNNAEQKPLVVLVDISGLLYRMFHTRPPQEYNGQRIESARAVLNSIRSSVTKGVCGVPHKIYGVFDPDGNNFRHRIDPEYKKDSKGMPEDLKGQEELVKDLLPAIGAGVVWIDDFEADDAFAVLSEHFVSEGCRVLIETVDKDILQLVDEEVFVYNPMSKVLYDSADKVEQKLGVKPSLVSSLLAITGDKSDGIPGIPGAGLKTAAKWLNQFGSLDALLDNSGSIGGKAGERLSEEVGRVRLNKHLTDLNSDVSEIALKKVLEAALKHVSKCTSLAEEFEHRYGIPLPQLTFASGPRVEKEELEPEVFQGTLF